MNNESKSGGYRLPVNPGQQKGTAAQGFVTPKQDQVPQVHSVPGKRVLPIIFIPGIMGSNLRMSADRQKMLGEKNNIAWRPDNLAVTLAQSNDTPTERQLRLDPKTTEVDGYDPQGNPTGDKNETSDERNDAVKVTLGYAGWQHFDGPLLQSDLPGSKNPRTKNQKARERGWGEVYFSSYNRVLSTCESLMNAAFFNGRMNLTLKKYVEGVNPSNWQAHPSTGLKALDEKTMRDTVKGCWFPVHAMGYNWLKGNGDSGVTIALRIEALIKRYAAQGYQCEKVILVTHSMGGLVARAVIHPDMGNIGDKVLGIVHGVMPATGAGAAYKRVRCGFEGSGIGADVLGAKGSHVTPVLGNAQGGLELLPSQAYGNSWLQVTHARKQIMSLPKNGDPYEEIYKLRGKWYGLLNEDWLNPARLGQAGFTHTCYLLDQAKKFHASISATYHDQSFAHYGADPARVAWHRVVWDIDQQAQVKDVDLLQIIKDDEKGKLTIFDPTLLKGTRVNATRFEATLQAPADPGDETLPLHSAQAQLHSGKFKGVFCQTGYEHQASYSNDAVIHATLYSLFRIASTMKWSQP